MDSTFYAFLETTINNYCYLDPDYRDNLAYFQDKVIKVEVKDPQITFYILANPTGFQIHQNFEGKADTTISASLINYLFLLIDDEKGRSDKILSKKVHLSGNTTLGQRFQAYFQDLDIDWEEHLARLTGDFVAFEIINLLRNIIDFKQETMKDMAHSLAEYLVYKTQDLVSEYEVREFIEEVDECRNDVDRLDARIKRLATSNSTKVKPKAKAKPKSTSRAKSVVKKKVASKKHVPKKNASNK